MKQAIIDEGGKLFKEYRGASPDIGHIDINSPDSACVDPLAHLHSYLDIHEFVNVLFGTYKNDGQIAAAALTESIVAYLHDHTDPDEQTMKNVMRYLRLEYTRGRSGISPYAPAEPALALADMIEKAHEKNPEDYAYKKYIEYKAHDCRYTVGIALSKLSRFDIPEYQRTTSKDTFNAYQTLFLDIPVKNSYATFNAPQYGDMFTRMIIWTLKKDGYEMVSEMCFRGPEKEIELAHDIDRSALKD